MRSTIWFNVRWLSSNICDLRATDSFHVWQLSTIISVIWEWLSPSISELHQPLFLWFDRDCSLQCLAVIWLEQSSLWFVFWCSTVRIYYPIYFIQLVTISFPNINMRPYSRLNPEDFPDLTLWLFCLAWFFYVYPYLYFHLFSLDRLTLLCFIFFFLKFVSDPTLHFLIVHIDFIWLAFYCSAYTFMKLYIYIYTHIHKHTHKYMYVWSLHV